MPTIVRQNHDNLNVSLTLNIPLADYEPQYKAQLNKYRKEAHMKGFRKGKTPLSVVRKMYGKGALVDIINNIVGKELDDYLKAENFDIIGSPIASENQEEYEFDTKKLEDFVFKFDIGLEPEFEVQGLEDTTFERYDTLIPDSMIDSDLEDAQKRLATQDSVEDKIQEEDIIKLQADELEGDRIKENGFANEFSLSFPEMTDAAKEIFKGKKKGDLVKFDIFNLSEKADDQFVRKYFLDVNEDAEESPVIGNDFQALITEVTRAIPSELNQEFFDKYFGPDNVKTEAEAREKMKENTKTYYGRQEDALLFSKIKETLEEKNDLQFPIAFLKRWMVSSDNLQKGQTPEDGIDELIKGLSWNLIQKKLAKRFDLKVEEPEIKQVLRMQIISYLGGQDLGSLLDDYVEKMMTDKQQYHNAYTQVLSDKLFKAMKEVITTKPVEISTEGLEKIIQEENAKYAPPQPEMEQEQVVSEDGIEEAEIIEE